MPETLLLNYAELRAQYSREARLQTKNATGDRLEAFADLLPALNIHAAAINSTAALEEFRSMLAEITKDVAARHRAAQERDADRPEHVTREDVSTARMTAGNENRFTRIIQDGRVKHWVGIGWISERAAKPEDYDLYPELIEEEDKD